MRNPALVEEDRTIAGVLVRTQAGLLAQRHPWCVQAGDEIEGQPIAIGMATPEEKRRCSMCGELIPWSR